MSKFDEIDEFLDVEPVDTPKVIKLKKQKRKKIRLLTMNIQAVIYIL